MLKLGEFQSLTVSKKVDFGVYLTEKSDPSERVLLPKNQIQSDIRVGDTLTVFIYRDSSDRLISTLKEPLITLGKTAALKVKDVAKIGAFLDWGLEKDLFLPYKEMTKKVKRGDDILVRLYLDKSGRLAASMRHLYDLLSTRSPYVIGDEVQGRIYEFGHDFGTFVAVDDKYSGMIPSFEDTSDFTIGDILSLRVTNVKEDGKLDLSTRKRGHLQLNDDAAHVMEIIESYGGVLPFSESAKPQVIMRETGLSKSAFKRAIGHLYKERLITLNDGVIRKNEMKGSKK